MEETPKLIEPSVKTYMQTILQRCNDTRVRYYSFTFNAVILVVFVVITVSTLWYCHSRKLTPKEKLQKLRKDQEFVLTKIRQFQIEKDSQKEQFSRLLNRVSTSSPVPSVGSVYIPADEEDPTIPVSMVPSASAPPPPSYRDLLYREIIEDRRKAYP
jgi:hypothetical protein